MDFFLSQNYKEMVYLKVKIYENTCLVFEYLKNVIF